MTYQTLVNISAAVALSVFLLMGNKKRPASLAERYDNKTTVAIPPLALSRSGIWVSDKRVALSA